MKSLSLFFAAFTLLASPLLAAQLHCPKGRSGVAAIERLEEADAAAKANDPEALIALWTEDGVLIQPMAQPVVGKAAIHKLLVEQTKASAKVETISYEESWRSREVNVDQAFEWGTITVVAKLPNGRQLKQTVYAGRYLVRLPDCSWRFARVVISPAPDPQ